MPGLVGYQDRESAYMNQKDRLFVQRELIAWSNWMRQGRTFPNALGYKSSTVEYALMRGETGGDYINSSKVPSKFNCDRNVEIIDKTFWRLPENQQSAITGIYIYKMPERRIAVICEVSRHEIRKRLFSGYSAVYLALTTKNLTGVVVSA